MTRAEKAKAVISLALAAERRAAQSLGNHNIHLAGQVAMQREWTRQNPDDGVGSFSSNPHTPSVEGNRRTLGELMLSLDEAQQVLELAIQTFVGMIE